MVLFAFVPLVDWFYLSFCNYNQSINTCSFKHFYIFFVTHLYNFYRHLSFWWYLFISIAYFIIYLCILCMCLVLYIAFVPAVSCFLSVLAIVLNPWTACLLFCDYTIHSLHMYPLYNALSVCVILIFIFTYIL
jgi:hypothetical protein